MEAGARREYLKALGIQSWVMRGVAPTAAEAPSADSLTSAEVANALPEFVTPTVAALPDSAPRPAPSIVAPASPPASPISTGKASNAAPSPPDPPPWLLELPPDDDDFIPFDDDEADGRFDLPLKPRPPPVESLDWESLEARVAACTDCDLHLTRTRTVFGVGDRQARLMVIGEAPGADEDRQGEPFVGRAGQLLTAMLRALGLRREQVYIANILKCRPPGNRDPHADEAARCDPYLRRQIALISPKVILAVGRIAAQNLLHSELPVGRLRGVELHYGVTRIPLVVSYHPSYLLRSPEQKGAAWQDWQRAARLLRGS